MPLGDVQLVVARRGAVSARDADAPVARPDDLGPVEMILQAASWLRARTRESPTTTPGAVDQRDAIAERVAQMRRASASAIGVRAPLVGDHASDACELVPLLLDEPVAKPAAGDEHEGGDERRDDDQRADEEPPGEASRRSCLAGRGAGSRNRAPSRSCRPRRRASRAAAARACPRCASGCPARPPTPSRAGARAPARGRAARPAISSSLNSVGVSSTGSPLTCT